MGGVNKNMKKKMNIEKTIAFLSLSFVFFTSLILFYRYIYVLSTSDYPAHIRHALRGKGYSLITILFPLLHRLTDSNILIVLLMSVFVVLTVLATVQFIYRILLSMGYQTDFYCLIPISCSLLYFSKLCIPEWSQYFFQDSFTTQPWHNSTSIAMRLFGIAALLYYFLIQKEYLEKIEWKDCLLFTVMLSLTNLSKPNMFLAFAPVMLIVLICDFIRTRTKSFRNAFIFGCCVLVSISILLVQYKIMYLSSDSDGSVVVSLKNALDFLSKDRKLILHLLLNYAFPVYVTVLFVRNRKQLDDFSKRIFLQSWGMNVLTVLISIFVTETGSRAADGNYGWGNPFFAYLLFAVCLIILYKMKEMKLIKCSEVTTARNLYYAHVIFGVFYFVLLLMGYLSWGI